MCPLVLIELNGRLLRLPVASFYISVVYDGAEPLFDDARDDLVSARLGLHPVPLVALLVLVEQLVDLLDLVFQGQAVGVFVFELVAVEGRRPQSLC